MEKERASALREIFEGSQDIRFLIPVLAIKFAFATRVGYTLPIVFSPLMYFPHRPPAAPLRKFTVLIVGGTYFSSFFFSRSSELKRQ